ncbi:MAG: tetratricopeptide repeat protein [Actinomycetota bacterium]|nr:tetratricopeptide repeat protein [Actinomycetota bacterium]
MALFQFATNAVGKVPAVFENMLALYFVNALENAAGFQVEQLIPRPKEGELLSLTKVLAVDEVREARTSAGAEICIWGSLDFGPEGERVIGNLDITMLVTGTVTGDEVITRRFKFNALSGDVESAVISVDIPALEGLVEDILLAVADLLGHDRSALRLDRIGEGLTCSDRAMIYFVYALKIARNPDTKLKLYLKAISADPYFALAYTNVAQLLIGEGRFGEAMKTLLRAQAHFEGSEMEPDVLNLLGVATLHLGMWKEAVNVWSRSLEARPDYVEVLCNLASAYGMRDMIDEAEGYCRQAIAIDERYPLAWFSLGRIMAKGGRYEGAEEAIRRYIELCPGDPWAYNILGTCLAKLGKDDEAEFELSKAVQLDPDGEAGALARGELQQLRE